MRSIQQISDPHCGTEQQPVMEALERLAQVQQPSLVIMSGDLTQRAKSAQFLAADSFWIDSQALASLVIPATMTSRCWMSSRVFLILKKVPSTVWRRLRTGV